MSVNRPTDPKLRDQDIEKKLQLYGIVTAFGHGKVPSVSTSRDSHWCGESY